MVLLSFDTEEFDVPREHGVAFTLEQGMTVSRYGTLKILDILKANDVKATFFCTSNFVINAPDVVKRIKDEGHEIACHGCDHWNPEASDVRESKRIIEERTGVTCRGYRQPRMFPVSDEEVEACGYRYNSSLNPAFIPGRYIHLNMPRTCFKKGEVLQIPASVSPVLRIPLFWLALHVFPQWFYRFLTRRVLSKDGYFTTYFHPWEFYSLKEHPEFRMPLIIRSNSGRILEERLDTLIKWLKSRSESFLTYSEFTEIKCNEYDQTCDCRPLLQ